MYFGVLSFVSLFMRALLCLFLSFLWPPLSLWDLLYAVHRHTGQTLSHIFLALGLSSQVARLSQEMYFAQSRSPTLIRFDWFKVGDRDSAKYISCDKRATWLAGPSATIIHVFSPVLRDGRPFTGPCLLFSCSARALPYAVLYTHGRMEGCRILATKNKSFSRLKEG